jgi:DNA-binding transcriptional MerR regulator
MPSGTGKAIGAFRTIGEVSEETGLPQHILRYWETRFPQLKPLQRAGNRRYYRAEDVALVRRIDQYLNREGYTVRGVQQLLAGEKRAPAEIPGPGEIVAAAESSMVALRAIRDMLASLRSATGTERIASIRKELQDEMDKNAQVFRTDESLEAVTGTIQRLRDRFRNISVQDKGKRFNTDLLEAVELGFLLDLAEVVVYSARNRKESRGGHMRDDFPKRDDENYMQHTMAYLSGDAHSSDAGDHIRLDWKPVVITRYQPMERKY